MTRSRRRPTSDPTGNPESDIIRAALDYGALDRASLPVLIRVNAGIAYQGRRLFAASGTVRLRDGGAFDLSNRWLLLDPTAVHLAPEGTSDLVGCTRWGQFVAAEGKTEAGKLSPAQETFLSTVHEARGLALVFRNAGEFAEDIARAVRTPWRATS